MFTVKLLTKSTNKTKVILHGANHEVKMAVVNNTGSYAKWGGVKMFLSAVALAVSSALLLFYMQTICEKAVKREFNRPYFKQIIKAFQLEYPLLRDGSRAESSFDFSQSHLALKCDFITLKYLLENGNPARRCLSGHEKLLFGYFRFLLFSLSIRHALGLREREVMSKLTTILQFFANSVGERLNVKPIVKAQVTLGS